MDESLAKRLRGLRGPARLDALQEVVSRWRTSGRSQAAFCREAGIAPVTLARWVRRVEAAGAGERDAPVFLEVGRPEAAARGRFEVILPDGTRVLLPSGFGDDDLARLLRALIAAC